MDITAILLSKYPDAKWTLDGDSYAGLEWLSKSEKPSESELEALWPEVQYGLQVAAVEEQRQAAYQLESDPLFFKYQRNEDGVTKAAWVAKVEEIRERYPMPEVQ